MIAGSRTRHAAPQTAAGLVRSRRGFTLVEVAVALLVLTAALGGTSYAVARAVALGRSQRETALAMEAALSVVETVKGTPFDQVFVRFNQDPLDDPMGLASPGNFFAVRGLNAQARDPDGFVGEIVFPGNAFALREDAVDVGLGMPRDLNGDTFVDALDHAADYAMLPFRVRVQWFGAGGNREIEVVTTVTFD